MKKIEKASNVFSKYTPAMIFFTTVISIIGVSIYYANNYVAVAIFVLLAIGILLFCKKKFKNIINYPGLFGFSWFFMIGLACLQLHQNQVNWKVETWVYFILAYELFLVGYWVKGKFHLKRKKETKSLGIIDKRAFRNFIILLCLISTGAFLVEFIVRKELPLFSSDMSSYMDFGVSGLHYFTVSACLIPALIIIYVFYYHKKIKVLEWVLLAIMCGVALFIPVAIVSRQLVIITLVLCAVVLLYLKPNWTYRILLIISAIGVVGWITLTNQRNQSDIYLRYAMQIQENAPLDVKGMQAYMYLSCNFDNFNLNVNEGQEYYYGVKSLFPIFAFTGLKFFIPSVEEDNLNRITPTYNTYPVIMRPYQDFGLIGVIIYMIILGVFCRFIEDLNKKNPANMIIQAVMAYCVIFVFFTNGFATPTIWFYLIMMAVLGTMFFRGRELPDVSKK